MCLMWRNQSPHSLPRIFLSMNLPLGDPWVGSASTLRGALRHCRAVSDRLITRWRDEYLVSLRAWRNADSSGRRPKKGDIVLVREGPKRSRWPIAAIVEVLSDRVAIIRLNGTITRRATKLLYPLEAEPPWDGPRLEDVQDNPGDVQAPVDLDNSVNAADSQESEAPRVDRRGRAIRLPARYRD